LTPSRKTEEARRERIAVALVSGNELTAKTLKVKGVERAESRHTPVMTGARDERR
jgi:hypothetical protein